MGERLPSLALVRQEPLPPVIINAAARLSQPTLLRLAEGHRPVFSSARSPLGTWLNDVQRG